MKVESDFVEERVELCAMKGSAHAIRPKALFPIMHICVEVTKTPFPDSRVPELKPEGYQRKEIEPILLVRISFILTLSLCTGMFPVFRLH